MPNQTYRPSRSDEVQEILGTPPNWLLRSGAIIALVTLVLLGWIGYLLVYPDIVKDRIRITSVVPLHRLLTERTVFIEDILVNHEDTVEAGQTLMVFSSTAKFEDVHILEDYLLSVHEKGDSALMYLDLPRDLILGDLQEHFYTFLEAQDAVQMRQSGRLASLSIGQLERSIARERAAIRSEQNQIENLKERLELARKDYVREQNLEKSKLSSIDRVRAQQEQVLTYERMIAGAETLINDKQYQIKEMQRKIAGVRTDSDISETQSISNLKDAYANLISSLDGWKRTKLLVSPIKGVAILHSDVGENQYVTSDEELAIILPTEAGGIIGRIDLDLNGSGKVKVGQRVVVKFDSYPFAEFGAVEGRITRKGRIPTDEQIPLEVEFPEGLVTNTGRQLEATQDMLGSAEIVTEEKRFLSWIFESFRG